MELRRQQEEEARQRAEQQRLAEEQRWQEEEARKQQQLSPTIVGNDGAEMMLVPAGEFTMGSNEGDSDEKPVHKVYLDAFYIDKYEVTNALYGKFMQATRRQAPVYWNDKDFNAPNQPVVGISWDDAQAYCEWAGKRPIQHPAGRRVGQLPARCARVEPGRGLPGGSGRQRRDAVREDSVTLLPLSLYP